MDSRNSVTLEIIPQFQEYEVKPVEIEGVITSLSDTRVKKLSKQVPKDAVRYIQHFPVILIDGIPWDFSSRYLLGKLEFDLNAVSYQTLIGIARDLRDFICWVFENGIDYLRCESKLKSPLRRYRRYLEVRDYSPAVMARKLSRMVAFYRWLMHSEGIVFERPLWNETEVKIFTSTRDGTGQILDVITTDVQRVRGTSRRSAEGYDGFIQDGGQLRPHNIEEQSIILNALREIGNIEMELSFLVALLTGARMQTVFTLRKVHFSYEPKHEQQEVLVYAGPWKKQKAASAEFSGTEYAHLIDTKNRKPIKLYFPTWLYNRIRIYLRSERYARRSSQSRHYFENQNQQYLFLTTRKNPFYIASSDPTLHEYRYPQTGAAVQQFISQQLKPVMSRLGFEGHFKFHNLRATFGMNIVRSRLPFVGIVGHETLEQIFKRVQTRMGHSNMNTTWLYLKFDDNAALVQTAQSAYESHLYSMLSPFFSEG